MNTKKLILWGVILIAIIGIVFLTEKLGSRKASSESSAFFPGFSMNTCSAFRITTNEGKIKIKKKDGIWVIASSAEEEKEQKPLIMGETEEKHAEITREEYPADSASVVTALEKISNMHKDELISQNPEKQDVFEVDSAHGIFVELWDNNGESIGAFRIGKNGPNISSHFVRLIGSDDVYNVGGGIKYSFYISETRWRDKTIMKFDQALAKKITIAKKDSAVIELEKSYDTAQTPVWNIVAPIKAEADNEVVKKIVKALAGLNTSSWEEDKTLTDSAMGFSPPQFIASVELENGDKKTLHVGNKKEDKSEFWLKTEGNETVFLVYQSRFSDIDKSLDELKLEKKEDKKEDKKEKEEEKTS